MAIANSYRATKNIEQSPPSWNRSFGPAERQQMLHEDSTAFGTVSLELVAIVILGLIIMAITVTTILLTS